MTEDRERYVEVGMGKAEVGNAIRHGHTQTHTDIFFFGCPQKYHGVKAEVAPTESIQDSYN